MVSCHWAMITGGCADDHLCSRPGTLCSILNGGENPPDLMRALRPVTATDWGLSADGPSPAVSRGPDVWKEGSRHRAATQTRAGFRQENGGQENIHLLVRHIPVVIRFWSGCWAGMGRGGASTVPTALLWKQVSSTGIPGSSLRRNILPPLPRCSAIPPVIRSTPPFAPGRALRASISGTGLIRRRRSTHLNWRASHGRSLLRENLALSGYFADHLLVFGPMTCILIAFS